MIRCSVAGRTDWRAALQRRGCSWYGDGDGGCWQEQAVWELTPAERDQLLLAAAGADALFREGVAHVVRRGLWARLGFSPESAAVLQASWERADPSVLGRFDFLMTPGGQPKLIEYNADNALSLVEVALLQRDWRDALMPGHEQCSGLAELIIAAWRASSFSTVHCVWRPRHAEVARTLHFMAELVRAAGREAVICALHTLGWDRSRRAFIDPGGRVITCCWKVYPWEWMLREPFAPYLKTAACQWFEPPWRLLCGHKGMLALLWHLFPDHPALLPCHREWPKDGGVWVSKPVLGREGANITIRRGNEALAVSGGEFEDQPCIHQRFAESVESSGWRPQFGVWMCGAKPAAIGIRETRGLLIHGDSPFAPHVVKAGAGEA